jgi:cell division protein FtsB
MQSAQESLAELRAAIRYCENAISAAESTIESMDFRQQLAKQQAMNKQESTGREVALEAEVAELKTQLVEERNRSMGYTNELEKLRSEKEASSGPCGCQAYRDLEEKVATMPVIPRDVAIAIFREGQRRGYNDKSVAESLKGLCKKKGFECRIHGIDDIEKS